MKILTCYEDFHGSCGAAPRSLRVELEDLEFIQS